MKNLFMARMGPVLAPVVLTSTLDTRHSPMQPPSKGCVRVVCVWRACMWRVRAWAQDVCGLVCARERE